MRKEQLIKPNDEAIPIGRRIWVLLNRPIVRIPRSVTVTITIAWVILTITTSPKFEQWREEAKQEEKVRLEWQSKSLQRAEEPRRTGYLVPCNVIL